MSKPAIWGIVTVVVLAAVAIIGWAAWNYGFDNTVTTVSTATVNETAVVDRQQAQYNKAQPVPFYTHSYVREFAIEVLNLQNKLISTTSVVRSMTGKIEFVCPSLGFGLPFDVSVVSPSKAYESLLDRVTEQARVTASTTVPQMLPTGVFSSNTTTATWVLCIIEGGSAGDVFTVSPHYFESFVSVYPYDIVIAEGTERITRASDSNSSARLKLDLNKRKVSGDYDEKGTSSPSVSSSNTGG